MKNIFRNIVIAVFIFLAIPPIAKALICTPVNQGGTGVCTISGLIKGNGTSPFSTATPGTDYEVPLTFSAPLVRTVNTISIPVATGSVNGYLSSADWTTFNGKQASGNYITALTGDITATGPGSVAATLATVNSNVGSFGSSTSIPSFTVNGKGLITASSGNVVIAPAGTLTGTTLASNVITSSLTTVGTIGSGIWQGSVIAGLYGGTGVANSGKTITLGGNLTTSGTFASTFIMTGTTTVTFPITGTLATLAGSEALTNKSVNGVTLTAAGSATKYLNEAGSYVSIAGGGVTSVASADGSITVTNPTTTVDLSVVSAPKLTTARTINGVSFDGTANITVTAAAGTLTGTTLNSTVVTSSLTSVGTIGTGVWQGTKIGLVYGGTNADLSATGGAGQYLKQSSSGAAITVGTIPASDIASGAALTKVDDTNITLTLGGSPSTALLSASSLTLGWTGSLAVGRGGTGGTSAGITLFNNITGYTASGATGTTSTNLVFSTSPTLITPALGTPTALVGTNITGTATGFTSGSSNALQSATTTVNTSSATAPSSGQVLTATSSTAATWQTPAATVSPFFQNIATNSGATIIVYGVSFDRGNGDMYVASASANGQASQKIYAYSKDTSGQYYNTTNNVTPTCNYGNNSTGTNGGAVGMSVVGSYVYLSCSNSSNQSKVYRYDKTTLANEQAMTISGTVFSNSPTAYNASYTDGTDLYIESSSTTWYRYTISGTTITNAATITQTVANVTSAAYNGTSVYLITDNSNGFTTGTIYKTTLTGGSATSENRGYIFPTYPGGITGGLGFPAINGTMYIVASQLITNATSNVALNLALSPIAAF